MKSKDQAIALINLSTIYFTLNKLPTVAPIHIFRNSICLETTTKSILIYNHQVPGSENKSTPHPIALVSK